MLFPKKQGKEDQGLRVPCTAGRAIGGGGGGGNGNATAALSTAGAAGPALARGGGLSVTAFDTFDLGKGRFGHAPGPGFRTIP